MFNINNNNTKDNNKNPVNAIKLFKPNETSSRRNINKKIRRSNTLHAKYDY